MQATSDTCSKEERENHGETNFPDPEIKKIFSTKLDKLDLKIII